MVAIRTGTCVLVSPARHHRAFNCSSHPRSRGSGRRHFGPTLPMSAICRGKGIGIVDLPLPTLDFPVVEANPVKFRQPASEIRPMVVCQAARIASSSGVAAPRLYAAPTL